MMYWSLSPLWFIDVVGSLSMITVSFLCLRLAGKVFYRDVENAMSAYLFWFCMAIFAFSVSRSLGHIIKHIMFFSGHGDLWKDLAPLSGSINTMTFLVIGAITLFFNRMQIIIHKMTLDREKIEKTGCALLNLNRDMENIVSERTRAEMALRIAHEIRNPVTIIGGLVRRLQKKGSQDAKEQDKMGNILEQTQKLEALLSRFEDLLLARKEHFIREDVVRLVNDAKDLIMSEAEEKKVKILYIPAIGEQIVETDASLIKVVIVHLLRNAIDACGAGDSVMIMTRMHSCWFELVIEDSGKGIPPEVLPYIFEPMYTSGEIKTGLGLPYIKQIIKEHKGTISIESEEGKGTRVTVRIPVLLGELGMNSTKFLWQGAS
ncbi:MAG: HAMP domain-containing sensor histidine kinase [Desulfobulbaceae bacterium]|nr:HAMP domain-containing sensor histidine kinase [Desulfobulbaceae bacterium]